MANEQKQLDDLYIQVAEAIDLDGLPDFIWDEIERLENSLNPPAPVYVVPKSEGHCGDSSCNGVQCWECAAIRGGCPEDV